MKTILFALTIFSFSISTYAHTCEGNFTRTDVRYLKDNADNARDIVTDYDNSRVRSSVIAYCPQSTSIMLATIDGSKSQVLNWQSNHGDHKMRSSYTQSEVLSEAGLAQPLIATNANIDADNEYGKRIIISGTLSTDGGSIKIIQHRFLFGNPQAEMIIKCSDYQLIVRAKYQDFSNDMDYVCTYNRN